MFTIAVVCVNMCIVKSVLAVMLADRHIIAVIISFAVYVPASFLSVIPDNIVLRISVYSLLSPCRHLNVIRSGAECVYIISVRRIRICIYSFNLRFSGYFNLCQSRRIQRIYTVHICYAYSDVSCVNCAESDIGNRLNRRVILRGNFPPIHIVIRNADSK